MIRSRWLPAAVLSGALACWGGYRLTGGGEISGKAGPSQASFQAPPAAARKSSPGAAWRGILQDCGTSDPALIRQRLAALKEQWLEEDLHVIAQTSARLLRSGEDAATGLPFEVGPGGSIRSWPGMRVFLLDILAIADPDLAAETAREILATTRSAEEYALALKPLLAEGPWRASDAELETHLSKLLQRQEWQESEGFAEALDLSRVVASPGTAEILARWMDRSPPAREVGEMALHETAAESPDLFVGLLAQDPSLLDNRGDLRASLMARATVSDETQAAQVQDYLRNPAIPAAEKESFLALYPLRSATTGYRLYGPLPKPYDRDQVAADDRKALETVGAWKADPALSGLLPALNSLEGRLQGWVKQAGD